MKVNPETFFTESTGKLTWEGWNALQEIADSASGGTTTGPGEGVVDFWAGTVKKVTDETIILVPETNFAGSISKTVTWSNAGTATFTFKVNGVAFSGTANDVSTTKQGQVHDTDFVSGDKIELTMSANSGCLWASFAIHFTRA